MPIGTIFTWWWHFSNALEIEHNMVKYNSSLLNWGGVWKYLDLAEQPNSNSIVDTPSFTDLNVTILILFQICYILYLNSNLCLLIETNCPPRGILSYLGPVLSGGTGMTGKCPWISWDVNRLKVKINFSERICNVMNVVMHYRHQLVVQHLGLKFLYFVLLVIEISLLSAT